MSSPGSSKSETLMDTGKSSEVAHLCERLFMRDDLCFDPLFLLSINLRLPRVPRFLIDFFEIFFLYFELVGC